MADAGGIEITITANDDASDVIRSVEDAIGELGASLVGLRQPLQIFELFRDSFGEITGSIVEVTSMIGFFEQGLSALQGFVSNGPFQLLIGQTIELQGQLLSTAATLVGTSKIISNGFEIKDAREAILSLNQPLNEQIRQLKIESLELVGVTSKELVPVFQQVASGITPIGASLTDARGLTLDFAAALGTLQIPLYQSRQEITSIFQGTIDQNSVLAKSLNINNEMVNKWKSQGKLVEELTTRLKPFREGNKLASQSFEGVTSNIQEVFDLIGQKSGEKLLAPLVQGLTEVYNFLSTNITTITAEVGKVTDEILRAGLAFQSIIKTIFGDVATVFKDIPLFLFTSLANALEALNQGLGFTLAALRPALNLFSALSGAIAPVASGFLVIALQAKALGVGVKILTSAFGVLGNVMLPGVGQLLPIITANAGALVGALTNLGGASVLSATGISRLFTNLQQIPGAVNLISVATAALSKLLKTIGVAVIAFAAFKVIDEFILKNEGLMEVLGAVFGGLGEVINILIGSWQSALITSTAVVAGLAFAFRAQLIPAILSFTKIQLIGFVGKATTAFSVLSGVLGAFGFGGMAASAGSAASALTGLSTAAGAGTLTLTGLGAALKGVAIASATLLAPLAAISAVVGGAGLLVYTSALKESTEATEILAERTDEYGNLAIDSLQQLSAARKKQQESEKLGIRLSDEEYKRNKQLQTQAQLRIGLIDDQVAALKEQEKTIKGDANKANIQSQIAELEKLKTSLSQISTDIQIAPKDLPQLGNTLEQLKKKADQAMQAILKPSGDQEIFKTKAGEVIELNMALLEMGATLDKDVIEKLRQLGKDTRLDQEVQRQAQETITKVIEQESQKRLDVIGRQKAEVEASQAEGTQGERESQRQITELTIKELNERKAAQEKIRSEQQGFGNAEAVRKAGEEIKKIEADITKAIAEERDKRNAELVKNFEEQQSIIEGYLAQGLTTEESFNDQRTQLQLSGLDEQIKQQQQALGRLSEGDKEGREAINAQIGKLQADRQKVIQDGYKQELDTLDRQLQKSLDLVKESELQRQIEVQKGFNESGGDENLINEDNVKNQLKTIEAEYNNTVKKLEAIKAQPPLSDPRLEAERQAQIRGLRQEQLQQSLEMLKTEKEAWDAHTQTILGNIARENNAQLEAIAKRVSSGQALQELEAAEGATDRVQELQAQIEREKEVNKQSELRLSLEKALREEREAWAALAIAETEVENMKELNASTQDYLNGRITQEDVAVQQAKDNLEVIEKQIQLNKDLRKSVELRKDQLEAIKALREAELDQAVGKIELQNLNELNTATQAYIDGRISKEAIAVQQAQDNLEVIEKELELNTDVRKEAELQKKQLEAIQALQDAQKNEQLAVIQLQNLRDLNQLTQEYLDGRISKEDIAIRQAQESLKLVEEEIALTSDQAELVELEEKRLDAIQSLREAEKNKRISDIESINNIELTALKRLLNQGAILREEYDLKAAQQSIRTLQERISLETDVNQKIQLQLQLVEAQGSLIDATVKQYESKLNKESQRYENSIKRQNQELDNQSRKMDALTKALQMRSELQDAQKGLFDAANGFYQGELDALVQGERSELKKKQLAELIAGIKLKSAIEQAKFEQQSLILQQQMKTIELEREEIAKRSALNQAKLDAKRAQSALSVAQSDPRTSPEQLEALKLEADLARENVGYQEQDLKLLQSQKENQSEIFRLQQESLDFRNQGAIRSAQVDLVNNTSNRGLKRQRQTDLSRDVLSRSFGVDRITDLTSRASATGEQALRESGLRGSRNLPGGISAEEQMRSLRGDGEFSSAVGRARDESFRLTGGLTAGVGSLPQSNIPLKLPTALTPTLTPSISQDFTRALQQAGVKGQTTISPTINIPITVTGEARVGESVRKQVEPRLENVIQQMVNLSRS